VSSIADVSMCVEHWSSECSPRTRVGKGQVRVCAPPVLFVNLLSWAMFTG
jgi:hypothetical protein